MDLRFYIRLSKARRPESVAVAPSNLAVMRGHLPCAAAERPLESSDERLVD